MMNEIKLLATCFISIIVIDFVWLGLIAKKFYTSQMSVIGRIYDGNFQPILWAAGVVYILLSIGIVYFVLPKLEFNASIVPTFLLGALMGFVIYGVYDMTNYSTLKDWTLILTFADMCWGAVVCGLVTVIARFVRDFSAN